MLTLKYFAEDPKTTKFEEFFTMWNTFIQSFSDIKTEIKQKKQREIEDRKAKETETLNKAKALPQNKQIHKRFSNHITQTCDENNEGIYIIIFKKF